MNTNFEAEFDNENEFTGEFETSQFAADFKHLTDTAETTATAADVMSGKIFFDSLGRKTTGTYAWDFKGFRPELLNGNLYSLSTTLDDTGYASWSPSTTAAKIIDTSNLTTFSADMDTYEYLLHWRYVFEAAYPSGTAMKAAPIKEVADAWQSIIRRPNTLAQLNAGDFGTNACVTLSTTPLLVYYNSSGSLTFTYSISYGIYPAVTAATFSNATTATPTVTVKTPSISARCSTTYFSTTRAGQIDQEHSTIKMSGELWRVRKGAVTRRLYDLLVGLYVDSNS